METPPFEIEPVDSDDATGRPPPAFVKAVKDALDHLYDFDRLNNHQLGRWLLPESLPHGVSHAHALRQRLDDAVARLDPGSRLPSSAPQRREFRILELRYVEAMPFREVMQTLALSQPQYHREQRHALEMLATYLWDTLPKQRLAQLRHLQGRDEELALPPDVDAESAGVELDANPCDDEVHLEPFLAEIVQLLGQVAAHRHVQLHLARTGAGRPVVVTTSRTVLRQAVLAVVQGLLECAGEDGITLSFEESSAAVQIDVTYQQSVPRTALDREATEKLDLSRRLMRSIGGQLCVAEGMGGAARVSLILPAGRRTLLVIEDNPSLVQLIKRYLADQQYNVLSAGSAEEGLAAAQTAHPDVILLDVMMPHKDGWDALQLLRYHPETSAIPVVVCTVLAEQELAQALGAAAFIRKPLVRSALLQTLERCLASPALPAAEGRAAPGLPAASE